MEMENRRQDYIDSIYTLLYENIDLGVNSPKNVLASLNILIKFGQNKEMIKEHLSEILDETDIVHESNSIIERANTLRNIITGNSGPLEKWEAAAALESMNMDELARQYDIDHAEEHTAIKQEKRENIYKIIDEYYNKAKVLHSLSKTDPNKIHAMLNAASRRGGKTKKHKKRHRKTYRKNKNRKCKSKRR